jgi:hypothetical protein
VVVREISGDHNNKCDSNQRCRRRYSARTTQSCLVSEQLSCKVPHIAFAVDNSFPSPSNFRSSPLMYALSLAHSSHFSAPTLTLSVSKGVAKPRVYSWPFDLGSPWFACHITLPALSRIPLTYRWSLSAHSPTLPLAPMHTNIHTIFSFQHHLLFKPLCEDDQPPQPHLCEKEKWDKNYKGI